MDESIDHYLCTSEWPDTDPVEASPWGYEQPNETNHRTAGPCGGFANNGQAFRAEAAPNLTANRVPSRVDYVMGRDMFPGGSQLQKGIDKFNDNCLKGPRNGWIKDEHDVNIPRFDSYSYESEEIPSICDGTFLPSAKTGSFGFSGTDNFDVSFGGTLPPVYDGYSMPDIVEDTTVQAFTRGRNETRGSFVNVDKVLQPNDISDREIRRSEVLTTSLATESTKAEKTMTNGQPRAAMETTYAPWGGGNVSEKPRVRARRGQATDPHSIAERLRREKISERMKSLQELVPNSSKTDKASMLDEIIEYVRFLQLQVKVLSMSRLGAAEAVVPLIAMGSKKASVSVPSSLENSPSSDQSAVEREIVKLMETDMNKAVQYLQSRGICLVPVPLASAISDAKAHERDNNSARPLQNSSSSSSNSSLS